MLPGLPATLCFAVIPNGAPYQMPGLPMLRIVILGIDPSGLPFSLCSNVIPRGLLTQSLSNKREAFVWLFSFSPAYTSELVTLP
jgi:hypothetical protein